MGTPPDPITFIGFSHFPPLFLPPVMDCCLSLSVVGGGVVPFDSASFWLLLLFDCFDLLPVMAGNIPEEEIRKS